LGGDDIDQRLIDYLVDTFKNESAELFSTYVRVALLQEVLLSREYEKNRELVKTSCATWNKGTVGMVDSENMNCIIDQIMDIVDSFIREYLVANP